MTTDESRSTLLDELAALRGELLETLDGLSEARLFQSTERDGWTVRHELSGMAAADHELLHVLESLAAEAAPVGESRSETLRRVRGEAMHRVQEQRLAGIRAQLGENATPVTAAIAGAPPSPPTMNLGDSAATLDEYLVNYRDQARSTLQTVSQHAPSR
jgi:hypothetical protein